MPKLLLIPVLVLASLLVAARSFQVSHTSGTTTTDTTTAALEMSAAYRDGLFQGKHDAQRSARRLCSGRWSTLEDRAKFAAGYHHALDAALR